MKHKPDFFLIHLGYTYIFLVIIFFILKNFGNKLKWKNIVNPYVPIIQLLQLTHGSPYFGDIAPCLLPLSQDYFKAKPMIGRQRIISFENYLKDF